MIEKIDWKKCNGLIPAIIQNVDTLEVLMLGFMNTEAVNLTINTQKVHFFSRTKNRIWMKGEESGNILNLNKIILDCDNDSLLILVKPIGNTCHTGDVSCFKDRANFISHLESVIDDRIKNFDENSYISKLSQKGINKIAQKVGEEGVETVIAALNESDDNFRSEAADLIFHLLVLMRFKKVSFTQIIEILRTRHLKYEK